MSLFTKLAEGIDVAPVLAELDARPDLWNTMEMRRQGNSPHRETSDIWFRYRDPKYLDRPNHFLEPHFSTFWPAWHALPSIHPVTFGLSYLTKSVQMGGILITRIPPGCQVYPHHDRGSWHAEYYDTKVWLPLRSNERCMNSVEDETIVWRPGECWTHDNLRVHGVVNGGDTERIVAIFCFRTS